MRNLKLAALVGLSGLVLSACGDTAETETAVQADTSETTEEVVEEPGLDQLEQKTKEELSKLGSEEEVNWDNIKLNKRQYKEYIESLADSTDESNEDTVEIFSSTMIDDNTIEITINNSDSSGISELTNQFFVLIMDSFSRQLYLHSDYSNGTNQPTIIIKDNDGNVISEAAYFIETEESEVETTEKVVEDTSANLEEVVEEPEETTIEEESDPEDESEPVSREQENALQSANDYLNFTSFSKEGLYDQLIFESYPEDAAQYAVDNVQTDWSENALQAAIDYLDFSAFSKQGLHDQLIFEGYTEEQAQYAMDNVQADWNENALQAAIDYLDFSSFSNQGLYDQLIFEGYTAEQAQYAIDNLPN